MKDADPILETFTLTGERLMRTCHRRVPSDLIGAVRVSRESYEDEVKYEVVRAVMEVVAFGEEIQKVRFVVHASWFDMWKSAMIDRFPRLKRVAWFRRQKTVEHFKDAPLYRAVCPHVGQGLDQKRCLQWVFATTHPHPSERYNTIID